MSLLALLLVNLGARDSVAVPPAEELGRLEAWVRYDAGWYYSIARDGYFYIPGQQSSVAFFPTYPVLMSLGGPVMGYYLTGVIVTLAAGLASVLLLTRWSADRVPRGVALSAVWLVLLYPYALFLYGAVYSDALFLACALSAFLLLERGHPWLAGLVGVLATAGRPIGVALALGLALRALELAYERGLDTGPRGASRRDAFRVALRHLRLSDAGVLLAGLGLVGYMIYQWSAFGTPVAFVLAQSSPGWDQGTGPEAWFKFGFFYVLVHGTPWEIARLLLPALLCLGALLMLPRVLRRFGWGYAAFTAVIVLIPVIGTKDFMGSGRYLLVAFPLFVVLAEILDSRPRVVRVVVPATSAVILGLFTALYGYGAQVS